MSQVMAIFKREFRSYFSTPIALIFLVVFLVLNGFFTFKLGGLFERGQADLRPFFSWHTWLFLFIVPAVSMRLWAEEKRAGTIELLLTLPVTLFQAMLGKFLAAWAFMILALFLTFPVVLSVCYLGDPDLGVVAVGYLGSSLLAGAFLAIGIFISAMTSNQIISFVVSTSVCLLFVLLGFEPVVEMFLAVFPRPVVEQLENLSFVYHFDAIQRGVIDMRDMLYFASLILFCLYAGVLVLDRERGD